MNILEKKLKKTGYYNQMITREELLEKAEYYDQIFPDFFKYGVALLKDFNERIASETVSPYIFLADICVKEWFTILNTHYKDQLSTISIEDLYYIREFLSVNYSYCCRSSELDEEGYIIDPSCESFIDIVNRDYRDDISLRLLRSSGFRFPDYEIESILEFVKNDDCDSYNFDINELRNILLDYGFENRWEFTRNDDGDSSNFAINESYNTLDVVKEYHPYDNYNKKTRHNISFDYTFKNKGVYYGIIYPGIAPNKQKTWVEDFVELTEYVIRGKYKIEDEIIVMEDLPWVEYDAGNNIDTIYGAAYSYHTCFIYYLKYAFNKNEQAFLEFTRLVYLTILNIYGRETPSIDVFACSANEIISAIKSFVDFAFSDCQHENVCNMKLNCLPEYHNTGFISFDFDLKHDRQNTEYADELIQKYTDIPSRKDEFCKVIACKLKDAGYDRNDEEYLDEYYKKLEQYKKYKRIYNKLYELAIVQEVLFLLDYALSVRGLEYDDIPNISRLSNNIQDLVYEDKGFKAIEKEMEDFSIAKIELKLTEYELNIYREFILILNQELTPNQSLEQLFQLKYDFSIRIKNRGINQEAEKLFEEINEKILSMIEEKVRQENLYKEVEADITNLINRYEIPITNKINTYIGDDSIACSEAFTHIKRALSTAEFLYKKYVYPYSLISDISDFPIEVHNMDFSCIALEYYTALEQLVNLLFFKPYRRKKLQPRYSEYLSSKSSSMKFNSYMKGFVGTSEERYLTYKNQDNRQFKESLELGNLSCLYKDALDNKGIIKKEYKEIGKYIESSVA